MSTQVVLPKLGFAMNEAHLVAWVVATGDTVTEGQVIYSIESDKAVEEVLSPGDGVIEIIMPAGGTYPVNTLVAIIR